MHFSEFAHTTVPQIEQTLATELASSTNTVALREAMTYAVMAGGKRLRPLLTLAVVATAGLPVAKFVKTASALELVHTYSLIHDDLPAMDNDDYRRGQPTTHRQFGEDMAILAGDALQSLAYEWVLADEQLTANQKVDLMQALTAGSGARGMVSGQVLDMAATDAATITVAQATQIHQEKTGELIAYALVAGGIIAQVNAAALAALRQFGLTYGLAFQIKDDLDDLDQDDTQDKQAYPNLLGIAGAKEALQTQVDLAHEALSTYATVTGQDIALLASFLDYFTTTLEK